MHPWTLLAHYNIPWGRQEGPIRPTDPILVMTGTAGFRSSPVSCALPQICEWKQIIWEHWLTLRKVRFQCARQGCSVPEKKIPVVSLCPVRIPRCR